MQKVLDKRTEYNQSMISGDFCRCLNCEKVMLLDVGMDICPECGKESLVWEDGDNKEVSDGFFDGNNEYILVQ